MLYRRLHAKASPPKAIVIVAATVILTRLGGLSALQALLCAAVAGALWPVPPRTDQKP